MKSIVKKRQEKIIQNRLDCFYLMILIHPLYDIIIAFFNYIGFSIVETRFMILLYIMVLFFGLSIVLKAPILKKNFLSLIGVYSLIFISYFFSSPKVQPEYVSVYMIIMYMYFIPLSVFVVSRIENWTNLFNQKKYLFISDLIIIFSTISKIVLKDASNYMEYSYNLLPIWGIVLTSALYYQNKKQWFFILIALFDSFVFGSRGALLWFFMLAMSIFVITLLFSKSKKILMKNVILVIVVLVLLIIAWNTLLPDLLSSKFGNSSYILSRLNLGQFGESRARIEIFNSCFNELSKMGLKVNGLFYDRVFLPNGMYSHNFIIETLLSMGWIFGISFLVYVFYIILRAFVTQNTTGKIVVTYLLMVLFMRFFISGSAYSEGKFVIFIAAIYSINALNKRGKRNA